MRAQNDIISGKWYEYAIGDYEGYDRVSGVANTCILLKIEYTVLVYHLSLEPTFFHGEIL